MPFNYRIDVLRDGIKQDAHTTHSRKVEHSFLDDVLLPWGQQVAVKFQIVCALALDVPAAAECVMDFHGISPNVLLASICMNVHFLAFSCRPELLKRSSTSVSHNMASRASMPKEITSSTYTEQRDHRIPERTRSISRSNVAGALLNCPI